MKKYVIGIDLGGTSCKLGIFTCQGELLASWKMATENKENSSTILRMIADSLTFEILKMGIKKSDVLGAGMGVPGVIMNSGHSCTCVNLGWLEKDVKTEMENFLALPVTVLNDANAAALGELWVGSGKGVSNLVMFTLGTGVGGGIILDGKPVSGAFGAGGEVGHMTVSNDEIEACGCGRYGCLEQYVSATGIVNTMKKKIESDKGSLFGQKVYTAKEIFDAAREKNKIALEVVEFSCELLGRAMASISCVLDPELYLLGGGVSEAGELLRGTVMKYFNQYVLPMSRNAKVLLASLGNEAGIYGAARSVLQNKSHTESEG